jgi:hypothetical protein
VTTFTGHSGYLGAVSRSRWLETVPLRPTTTSCAGLGDQRSRVQISAPRLRGAGDQRLSRLRGIWAHEPRDSLVTQTAQLYSARGAKTDATSGPRPSRAQPAANAARSRVWKKDGRPGCPVPPPPLSQIAPVSDGTSVRRVRRPARYAGRTRGCGEGVVPTPPNERMVEVGRASGAMVAIPEGGIDRQPPPASGPVPRQALDETRTIARGRFLGGIRPCSHRPQSPKHREREDD